MKVVVHAEALRELREAGEWYREHAAADRGPQLARAVDATIAEIARAPASFPRDAERSWARRAQVPRWPYAIVYVLHDAETVVVLAVAHGRRKPGYWTRRRPR